MSVHYPAVSGLLVRGVEITNNTALPELINEAESDFAVIRMWRFARGTRITD